MLHDPDAYDQPGTFNPDRFLQSEFGTKADADTEGRRNDTHFGAGRVGLQSRRQCISY